MKRYTLFAALMLASVLAAGAGARPLPAVVASLFNPGFGFAGQDAWIPVRLLYRNAGQAAAVEPVNIEFTLVEPGRARLKLDYLYGAQTVVPLVMAPGETRTSGIIAVHIPAGAPAGAGKVCAAVVAENLAAAKRAQKSQKANNVACFAIRVVTMRRILPATPRPKPPSPSPTPSPIPSPTPSPTPTASLSPTPSAPGSPQASASPAPPTASPAPATASPRATQTPTTVPTTMPASPTPAPNPTRSS